MQLILTAAIAAACFSGFAAKAQTSVAALQAKLRLPDAVRLQAFSYNNGEQVPFDCFTVVATPDSSQGTQLLNHGGAGFVTRQTELASPKLFVSYSPEGKRALISQAPDRPQVGTLEKMTTPLGWLRLLAWQEEHGKIEWTESPSGVRAVADILYEKARNRRWLVDLTWDDLSKTLLIKGGWSKDHLAEYSFSQWETTGGEFQHPRMLNIAYGPLPTDRRKLVAISEISMVDAGLPTPGAQLPPDAVITDLETGGALDARFQPIPGTTPTLPSAAPASQGPFYRSMWLWVGVGSLIVAVVGVWRWKRS